MLRKGHHRQVFEMGQEGQEKPESVSSMIGLGNFPIFPTLYTPKGTKGMNFQEFHNIRSWNLSRNFLPFVPLRVGWGIQGTKDRNFPMKEDIVKVTIVNAPNTPLVPGVI
jgi:hypothetical protein